MAERKGPGDAWGIAFALNAGPRVRQRLTAARAALWAVAASVAALVVFEGRLLCQ
jgi:hypothetical protein